ncbi:glycosyltransferase [uncultured Thiodictyon sp.]|uniref:glycosyltransferase n=1 Tax=uncultured Thiodictyon sp. TaxID=1846217 RepID=UPI0025FF2302|nr:glycosyltransferase [uncultured Thiodictyon sp.]
MRGSADFKRIQRVLDGIQSDGGQAGLVAVAFHTQPSPATLRELRGDPRIGIILTPDAAPTPDAAVLPFASVGQQTDGQLPPHLVLPPDLIYVGPAQDGPRLRLSRALRRAGTRRLWFVAAPWSSGDWERVAWLRALDYRLRQAPKLAWSLVAWSLRQGWRVLFALGRRVLPPAWLEYLGAWLQRPRQFYRAVRDRHAERRFAAAAAQGPTLGAVPPALPPAAFVGGPVVLVNNALAWGGVERQVVYVLKGLTRAVQRPLALRCLRLQDGDDYRFFLPALAGEAVSVRDIRAAAWAEGRLAQGLSEQQLVGLAATIAAFPDDMQTEVRRFLAEFLDTRPEVVHAWQDSASLAAGYAAVLAGVPRVILSSRNMRPSNFTYYRPHMAHAYRCLAGVPGVVLINNSEAGAADYADWLGVGRERFAVKRNGIDAALFRRPGDPEIGRFRAALGVPEGAPLVGSVFRLYDEKRPLLWVEMAALVARSHPAAHFVVFGTGPLQARARALGNRRGLGERLHLPGTTQEPQLAMSAMDLFVLTSSFEGTPNVVLEAQLLGVPVVATEAGGTREALDQGRTGWLVEQPTPAALAERVLAVLADPTWRERARTEAPRFVATRFGLQRMIDETLGLYGLHSDLPDPAGSASSGIDR